MLTSTFRTSGFRKGAEVSHYALIGQIAQVLRLVGPFTASQESIIIDFPMGQSVGQMMNMMLPLKVRGKLIVLKSSKSHSFRDAVEKFRPTFLTVLKPTLDALVCEGRPVVDLSSVKNLACGATFVPREIRDPFQELYGKRCDVGYGMAEQVQNRFNDLAKQVFCV